MPVNPVFNINMDSIRCKCCGQVKDEIAFLRTKSFLFPSGYIDTCTECLGKRIEKVEENEQWEVVDKICQYLDVPFEMDRYEEMKKTSTTAADLLRGYNLIYFSEEYEGINWGSYNEAYLELQKQNQLEEVIPGMAEAEVKRLQKKWGNNYEEEALNYLENLYDGLLLTQHINGALQSDQALKICKISYEIDCRIREGADFDKLLASYDKLVKTGEFTPKNVKNASDFESMGELVRWLEKRGFKNKFYDGETRDVVDETIKNIKMFNRKLYTNESSIGDEITQRIQSLKVAAELESYYDLNNDNDDFDNYENEGYLELFRDEDEADFAVDLSDGGE